ncbi:uncharacterized protein LOC117214328 [Bombus bifarius]|uniref:Uncharacterized protein LOC117214328 n=1 Tax=Bombus bifarius TaxID=103933 RepID=A0A6P8MQY7_9HYME|nr:uncharacterized protein LOC117214328 [Bombus bifarius]
MMITRQLKIPSLKNLSTIALFGSVIVTATGLIVRYDLENKIRQTTTYKKALKLFYDHKETIKHLGEPIKEGRITLPEYKSGNTKKFGINVKGTNTTGKLYFEYQVQPDESTEIKKVEIKFNDIADKIFVIHKN